MFVVALPLLVGGCQGTSSTFSSFGDTMSGIDDTSSVAYYRTDELVAQGKNQFKERNYGKSYTIFKRAVELFPEDPPLANKAKCSQRVWT